MAAAAALREARRRRLRGALDVTAAGEPAVQLPRWSIQALLGDRAPLMRDRGPGEGARKRVCLAPPPHAVVRGLSSCRALSAHSTLQAWPRPLAALHLASRRLCGNFHCCSPAVF